MLTLYGIPNCDTVKKARAWLADAGIEAAFHDYRKQGVPEALEEWVARWGWETVLNRAGTSFRKLPEAERSGINAAGATALMRAHPAMIKRPVVAGTRADGAAVALIGFKAEDWTKALGG